MTRAEFAPIQAFVMKQRSQLESFTVVPPTVKNALGVATGTISVNGALTAGTTTASIDNMTVSTNGILKAGDFFRFSGQDKVYMAVADLDSDGYGEGTLTFEPPLRANVSDDVDLVYDNIDFTVSLTNDIQEFSIGTTNYYTYEIDVVEVL
jgi:hypothetical protein